jgi:hypothetical protein
VASTEGAESVIPSKIVQVSGEDERHDFNTATAIKPILNSVALVRERTMPTERPPLVGEVVPTFGDRGCCVVSATNPPGR